MQMNLALKWKAHVHRYGLCIDMAGTILHTSLLLTPGFYLMKKASGKQVWLMNSVSTECFYANATQIIMNKWNWKLHKFKHNYFDIVGMTKEK